MKPEPPDPGYPHPSSPEAQRRLLACGQRDTAPELALRALLFRRGFRYRIDMRPIPGLRRKADVVFLRLKVAVFVDGCFWHGCPEHATWPKANGEYWRRKILGNRARDADTDSRLAVAGWLSLRVWEHEEPTAAAERVAAVVGQRRSQLLGANH
ncbi:MAG: very short patch repair endonuclease [Gemmataceae bacterium]|nr:very short patch repair endonuclease [Gemmataceae bacterium]